MTKITSRVLGAVATVAGLGFTGHAAAHFGMIVPSDSMVEQGESATLSLDLAFNHPFEMVGMHLVKPAAFGVTRDGEHTDLLGALEPEIMLDHDAWTLEYTLERPGVYIFAMEPQPYWEPAEDAFIVHYTKTYVSAFGLDEGWDAELGLPTEIVPLSKPFGLYAGNLFQGIVKVGGEPLPYAEVEVEFYNEQRSVAAPAEGMITQTIKADGNGVFTYAAPLAGWWGFAALTTAEEPRMHEGEEKAVEQGAVIWVRFHDFAKP